MDIFIYFNNSVKYPYLHVRENISDLPRFIQVRKSRMGTEGRSRNAKVHYFCLFYFFPPNFEVYAIDGSLSKMSKLNSHLLHTMPPSTG